MLDMSTSGTLASAYPFPLGSSTKHDPALKPNPHPYAIKTTHTALLSRSNSSGHNTPSRNFYTPPTGTPSRSSTKHPHEYRGHRYSTSLTGELPSPSPAPSPSPTHVHRSESEGDILPRRPRAETLPTYLADNDEAVSVEPEEELPLNPKTWTPSQLSVYLTRALRVRSGERPPERVARDIALWVRREGVTGRTFLRWTDENLKVLGVNMLWRCALLAAARSLRQNILRGRIWGNSSSDLEQEQDQDQELQDDTPFGTALYASSSSSLDIPLTGGDAEAGFKRHRTQRLDGNVNGHVRGMVDKWERESVGSRSPTRRSDRSYSRSDSESDNGSELGEGDVAAEEDVDMLRTLVSVSGNGASSVMAADDEPSIEDLLASESAPAVPKDGSWGARAWEELDAGTTIRRIEPHETAAARHDSSADVESAPMFETFSKRGSGTNNGSSRRIRGTNREDLRLARRTAADIFAVPSETAFMPALVEAGVQAEVRAETALEEEVEAKVAPAEAEVEAKELALEGEVRDTRALLEEFKRRLEEVEARVSAMEAKSDFEVEQSTHASPLRQQEQQSEAQGTCAAEKDAHDNAVEVAGLEPEREPTAPVEISVDEGNAGRDAGSLYADARVVRHVVDVEPTTVSDLPSYVLLVGLGVCAVVLQVVLRRVGGRSLRP